MDERRSAVARELHGLHKTIRAVRMFFVAVAVLAGTFAVSFALVAGQSASERYLLTLGVLTAVLIASIVGAIQVPFHPFAWGLVVAIVVTLGEGAFLWVYPEELAGLVFGKEKVVGLVTMTCAWIAVPRLKHVRDLIREQPDLFVVRRIRGTGEARAWLYSAIATVLTLGVIAALAWPALTG